MRSTIQTEKQHKLLIVDDAEWNRDMMRIQLSQLGFDVDCAADAPEALEMIKSYPYDLILLDIMMPGMNGLEMLAEVRKCHSMLSLPIIMVTADDLQEHIVDALNLGANDYIVKPLSMAVAGARVQTQLSLKKLVAMKEQFVKFASHDLKKPLIVSLEVIKSLEDECKPGLEFTPDNAELLSIAYQSCKYMQSVIDGFLGNKSANEPDASPHDIQSLLEKCIRNNREYAKQKHIHLKLKSEQNLPKFVGNEFQVTQVLENLIGNAIKFSPAHTTTTIETRFDDHCVYIDICDQGPGFSQQDLKKLFTPNAVLSNKPTGNETSSGVGLGLSKHLIEEQNGHIGAFNNPDQGATFWISLPREQINTQTERGLA
ncbi:MAG: response regulator [Gammaproteobacteria bacterium]|nr:response regulator [Gammaproteobacteria bacterium]MDH5802850.1 response regulator [Gammaproteobacteria bacterium]